jgi:sugar transferase (PEP-CTERM system associated)
MVRIFNQYTSPKTLVLILLEGLAIILSFICAASWPFGANTGAFGFLTVSPWLVLEALGLVILIQTVFYCNDLYDLADRGPAGDNVLQLLKSLGAATAIFGLLRFLIPGSPVGKDAFLPTLLLTVTLVALVRIGLDKAWPTEAARNILILGTGELAAVVAKELARRGDLNARLAGFAGSVKAGPLMSHPVLGTGDEIVEIATQNGVSRIIVALDDWRGALPIKELMRLRVGGVVVEDAHTALAALTGRVWLLAVRPSWLTWFVMSDGFRRSKLRATVKRSMDLFFALLGLLLTGPIQLLVALAVLLESGRPIIYRQVRVGLRGRPFEVLKFRSMRTDAEADGQAQWAQENDPRVTWLGRFLRNYRLDELPQFINVLRGEMSFVGPRPERPYFVEQLRERLSYYDLRHTVRPGITGWAQVRYYYSATIEDSLRKLEYDLFYMKHMSLLFDVSIIFQSIRTVLLGRGGR